MAVVYQKVGRYEYSINELKKAKETYSDVNTYYNLGIAYYRMGNLKKAEYSFLKSIYLKPDLFQGYSNLGTIIMHQRKLEKAKSYWNKALEYNPKDAIALKGLQIIKQSFNKRSML